MSGTGVLDLDLDDILEDAITAAPQDAPEDKPVAAPAEPSRRRRGKCPANVLFFDLETTPDYSRESLFGLAEIPSPAVYASENEGPAPSELIAGTEDEFKTAIAKAQAGGKLLPKVILEAAIKAENSREKPKPRKGVLERLNDMIAAIDNESSRIEAAIQARRKEMSVTPEFCRIVSFAWAWCDDPVEASAFGDKGGTKDHDTYERCVLKKFWELASRSKVIVGYNHVGFDLPVIYARSMLLGVDPSRQIDSKPWGGEVVDVMAARWPRGGAKKMKDYARICGIPVEAGDMDGSKVEETLKANPYLVAQYNRSDVMVLREMYLMGRGLFWS